MLTPPAPDALSGSAPPSRRGRPRSLRTAEALHKTTSAPSARRALPPSRRLGSPAARSETRRPARARREEEVEKPGPLAPRGGRVNPTATLPRRSAVPQKAKRKFMARPRNCIPSTPPKRNRNTCSRRGLHGNVHCSFLRNSPEWERFGVHQLVSG